eukprot:5084351-Prymnesium_polylepis.1
MAALSRPRGIGLQAISQDAATMLDHCAKLDIYSPCEHSRFSSIVCTIGPKSEAVDKLTMLRMAGMN